jgi:long-subunit fatty acid transport protein
LKNFHRDFVAGSNNVHTNQTMANYLTQFVNGNGVPLWAFGQDNIYDDERIGWLSILGYDTYSFMPVDAENPDNTEYYPMVDANSSNSNKLSYSERGYINEWAFSYGHNFNDIFYLGFTFGIQDLDYERSSYYMENYFWQEEQNDITGWLDLYNSMITTGTGVNFKLGTIFRPNDDLRLALAFHSPTWYDMRDVHYADSDSDQRVDNGHEGAAQTPSNSTKYSYRTPYKFVAGFGYIIGKSAIASIDYEFTDYTAMNLGDSSLASNLFEQANNDIDNTLKPTHSIKLGLEYRLTSNYSLRGGFAHISSPIESDAFKQIPSNSVRTDPEYLITKGTQYYSVGFGYRKEAFTFDFAYQFRTNKSDLYMTELLGTESLNVTTNTHNIVATAGFRF